MNRKGVEKGKKNSKKLVKVVMAVMVVLFLFPFTASGEPIAYINITNGTYAPSENITIMEHNWVELQGGVEVTIPELTFVYTGFNETNYTKDGCNILIAVNAPKDTPYEVTSYPYTKHQFFYNDSTIKVKLNTSLGGVVYYYVAKTSPTQVKKIADEVVGGNTSQFRDLFFNRSTCKGTMNLSDSKEKTIGNLQAGDYIIILTGNPLNESDFVLISSTWIEVLEYKSELTAPSPIKQDEDLEVKMEIGAPSASYIYGGVLIKKDVYEKEREIRLTSNATKIGTTLTIDDVSLIENWEIFGVGLGNVNVAKAQEIINDTIGGAKNGTISYTVPTSSVSKVFTITTEDLPTGTYILSVGVWQGSDKLVAFNQTEIEIVAPTPTPSGGGGGGGGGGGAAATVMNVPIDPATGAVTSTTTLTTEKATLTIPKGTIIKDAEGNPLSTSITALYTPTTAETVGAITAYNFGPSGTTFEPPIDLVIAYDPADIPEGFSESDLVIKMWDGTAWIALETTVDTVAHTATAKVSHFTIFALFAAPPVAPPPTPTVPPPVTPTPTPTPPVVPPKPSWALIIGIIIAVIIVVAAAYYFYTKKKA